eukprot:CAMPEP_0197187644 /NCGR_PEP_ID=MMETSP1423-20130617/16265_1 /TAXON_ID=476441 /ORGANISM="Pseudo-nitzschia heimii, Strain UNC1101" /LENGTH=299 /DNA_ID=CAMNT_0042639277 /DNA_START=104 /DNA_END=1000 /DNA_ORIENTATION=-
MKLPRPKISLVVLLAVATGSRTVRSDVEVVAASSSSSFLRGNRRVAVDDTGGDGPFPPSRPATDENHERKRSYASEIDAPPSEILGTPNGVGSGKDSSGRKHPEKNAVVRTAPQTRPCSRTRKEVRMLGFCSGWREGDDGGNHTARRFYLHDDFVDTDYVSDPTDKACRKLYHANRMVDSAQPLLVGTRELLRNGTTEDYIVEIPDGHWNDDTTCASYGIELTLKFVEMGNNVFACWEPSSSGEVDLDIPRCPDDGYHETFDGILTWYLAIGPVVAPPPKVDVPGWTDAFGDGCDWYSD